MRTRRTYILWVIPWGHVSTAYGYSQALNGVWKQYEKSIGGSADRTDFADALDFMNWYMTRTKNINHIPVNDAMRQYLAYHEGWGGYSRRSYARNRGLITIAKRVGKRASLYERQYAGCRESLQETFWEWLWRSIF